MGGSEDALILVVDDEETIRTLLSRALTSHGYVIVSAESRSDAAAKIEEQEFDLLLIDKNLPDGSGLEIISEARRLGHRSEAILITGYSDTESAIQAVALGVFRYVRKPFDLDALKIDIDNALETGRLRRDLARRTTDLENTNRELWDALKRVYESERRTRQAERLANIGYLAAGVAHEINNPLSLLSMTIPYVAHELEDLVDRFNSGCGEDEILAALQQISFSIQPTQEAVEFLMRLASDLHSLGRTEKQEPKIVKITEVAGSAMRLVRHQLKHRARVLLDVDETMAVTGHASRLVQVFINLLTNAAKAIPDNAPEANTVSILGRCDGDQCIVEVSDTGVGIPEDHLDKIFTPFFTHSLKDDEQGTGIGLALVKEIIDEHGGEISVSSEKGVGTTFRLILPRTSPPMSQSVAPPGLGELRRSKRKILIFAEGEQNLSAYESSFGTLHDVFLAESFDDVIGVLEERADTLDAIVCDLSLEGFGPSTFFDKIKRWPSLRNRCIFVGLPGPSLEIVRSDGYQVIEKPVRPASLLGMVYKLPPRIPAKPNESRY